MSDPQKMLAGLGLDGLMVELLEPVILSFEVGVKGSTAISLRSRLDTMDHETLVRVATNAVGFAAAQTIRVDRLEESLARFDTEPPSTS